MARRIVCQSRPYVLFGQNLVRVINEGASVMDNTILRLLSVNYKYAASVSLLDIQTAINSASPGDTIIVPAGIAAWASQLTITKAVTILGAGIGYTIITVASGARSFHYNPVKGTTIPFRFSGFRFNCNNVGHGFMLGSLGNGSSQSPIRNVRVDHCAFYDTVGNGTSTFEVWGPLYGVCDHCLIEGGGHCDNMGQNSCSDWPSPDFALGSENNFYWEDNTIHLGDNCPVCTGGHGGQYCYRYNTITYNSTGQGQYPTFDMHGNQSGVVGPHGGEIYENTIIMVGSGAGLNGRMWDHRGGQMMIFNNHYYYNGYDWQTREEYCNDTPCGSGAQYEYQVRDSYYWNNYNKGVLTTMASGSFENNAGCPIAESVNYWMQRTPFDGKVGMGVGLLSERPSSGLSVGVGWWATDERKLYRATSATTWELLYTPYTYPHPLISA